MGQGNERLCGARSQVGRGRVHAGPEGGAPALRLLQWRVWPALERPQTCVRGRSMGRRGGEGVGGCAAAAAGGALECFGPPLRAATQHPHGSDAPLSRGTLFVPFLCAAVDAEE